MAAGGQKGHHSAAVLDRDLVVVLKEDPGSSPNYLTLRRNSIPAHFEEDVALVGLEDDLPLPLFAQNTPHWLPAIALFGQRGPICPMAGARRACWNELSFAWPSFYHRFIRQKPETVSHSFR